MCYILEQTVNILMWIDFLWQWGSSQADLSSFSNGALNFYSGIIVASNQLCQSSVR